MILFICIVIIFILYRSYDYYKTQNKEMFKALCHFKDPYYQQDDYKYNNPIIEYIDKNGFNKKIIYDKSKWL